MLAERFGAGDVLRSSTSEALFLVLDAGAAKNMPVVNGEEMSHGGRQPCSLAQTGADGNLRGGQSYADHFTGLKLLCIRPGRGRLSFEGRPMTQVRGLEINRERTA